MTCPHAHDAGAYVLGALAPTERLAFERHLAGCEACARSVRELAGLPGLLGRVDPALLDEGALEAPLPDTLLPRLVREVRRARRRRTAVAAGLAAAVAAVVTAAGVSVLGGEPGDGSAGQPPSTASPSTSAPPSTTPSAPSRPMVPVGVVPVRASLTLEQVLWGTRLGLDCTYESMPEDEYGPSGPGDYLLVVRTRDGRTERVGSWRPAVGRTMHVDAATATATDDIASVEVRAPDGRVVLRLAA